MNTFLNIFFFLCAAFAPLSSRAATPSVAVFPQSVIQGEPLEITIANATTSAVKNISFDGKNLPVFSYQNKPTAFVGIDIHQKPAAYAISATVGTTTLTASVVVGERKQISTDFSIPETLGGNSTSSAASLVGTLAQENAVLSGLSTNPKKLWTDKFIFPLSAIVVTDPYGYTRQTAGTSLIHKGTDFRASIGTPVMAMNRGVVRLARQFTGYGKTIVIDHGLGLMTFYMHLSKINVSVGQLVTQGQTIGLSGQTGDALAPHLHLSVRIGNISIDPMEFMALFK